MTVNFVLGDHNIAINIRADKNSKMRIPMAFLLGFGRGLILWSLQATLLLLANIKGEKNKII